MSLGIIALINNLLGVVCGLWFRVLILVPLVVIAVIEVALFKLSGTALSPFCLGIGLIVLLEIGYLIGASIWLWLDTIRGKVPRGFARPGYREMSVIGGK